MATMDKYGRVWMNAEPGDLCQVCGQPSEAGSECDHSERSRESARQYGALSLLGQRVAVVTGNGGMVTYGQFRELTEDEIVVETRGIGQRRINRAVVDRVTGPYFKD